MHTDPETRLNLLKQVLIFNEFSEDELDEVVKRLKPKFVPSGETIFAEGDDRDNVYFILSGEVEVRRSNQGKKDTLVAVLDSGDSFGEDAIYHRRKRSASLIATSSTELFYLTEAEFNWIRSTFPKVEPYINAFTKTHDIVRRLRIDWLGDDETISLADQRHPIRLILETTGTLFFILVTTIITVGLIRLFQNIPFAPLISGVFGILFIFLALFAGLWSYLEWRNDYFFVTTHRVVWRERIIFRGASRQEVPLRAIQSLDVQTQNYFARLINVGNLVVRTFNSQLILTDVNHPDRMKDMIEAFQTKARQKSIQAEHAEIRRTIRRSLGHEDESPDVARIPPVVEDRRRPFAIFANRVVEGGSITYRKHWSVFLARAWLPTLVLMIIMISDIFLFIPIFRAAGIEGLFFFGFATFCVLGWWSYHYADWRNDIYRVTNDRIIDSDKKPFGEESFRSALLKNIQSVGHQIPNTIGLILNVGNVRINVGEEILTFDGVFDPALVHQDIARKMEELAIMTERSRLAQEHKRMATWLEIFHEEAIGDNEIVDEVPDF